MTRSPFDDRGNAPVFDGFQDRNAPRSSDKEGALRTEVYERWFKKMHASGENFCSIWMAPWWLEIEWSPTREGYQGIGYYNQKHAAQLDRIFELAEKYQISILLFTSNHGRLSTFVDAEWFDNPNRIENGGTAGSITEYLASDICRANEERRLRYILSRWGYSTACLGLA